MKICICDKCHYLFDSPAIPGRCPDCGEKEVRSASRGEIRQYQRFREIIREEIRLGVIPG